MIINIIIRIFIRGGNIAELAVLVYLGQRHTHRQPETQRQLEEEQQHRGSPNSGGKNAGSTIDIMRDGANWC